MSGDRGYPDGGADAAVGGRCILKQLLDQVSREGQFRWHRFTELSTSKDSHGEITPLDKTHTDVVVLKEGTRVWLQNAQLSLRLANIANSAAATRDKSNTRFIDRAQLRGGPGPELTTRLLKLSQGCMIQARRQPRQLQRS